ncbi:MAG: component of SufBCD complex [Roseovarius sp.]|nr:component of SufBCD complex [Roseovarius sp.]
MTFLDIVLDLIDRRTFGSLWFWIALGLCWTSVSYRVLGVPWDVVVRARRCTNGAAMRDFEDMVRINTNRLLLLAQEAGPIGAGLVSFLLTSLGLLGFGYGVEFAQAVFLLGLPLTGVGLLSLRAAQAIRAGALSGEALVARIGRHRLAVRLIGAVSIFVTALWGMYHNMNTSVLG